MGPIRCPETSVKDYHSTLRNAPEERRSDQHRDGSLKSREFNLGYTKCPKTWKPFPNSRRQEGDMKQIPY
jgi:hypothetical protein